MRGDLQQRCEQVFVDHVEELFERNRAAAIKNVGVADIKYLVLTAPYIDFLYSACDDNFIPKLKTLVCAALAWRERFRTTKPAWAPDLPLNFDGCEKLENSCSKRMREL